MHSYILTSDNPEYEWNYIPAHDNINSQIIIKKYNNNKTYIYNFNMDISESTMGRIDIGMSQLLGIPAFCTYKRTIINENKIEIYQTSGVCNPEVQHLGSSKINALIEP